MLVVGAGLLAGIHARVQRPEYAQLLSDCQILYCDTRLQLVSGVTHDAILHMSSEPLPVLARDGWAYLMQVGCNLLVHAFLELLIPYWHAVIRLQKILLCNVVLDLSLTCLVAMVAHMHTVCCVHQ